MGIIFFFSGYVYDVKFIVEYEIKEKCLLIRSIKRGDLY